LISEGFVSCFGSDPPEVLQEIRVKIIRIERESSSSFFMLTLLFENLNMAIVDLRDYDSH
jgi:hypothetical protein